MAGRFARSLGQMMVIASLLCAACCLAGLTISYRPDLPVGPTIILVAGAGYLITAALPRRFFRRG